MCLCTIVFLKCKKSLLRAGLDATNYGWPFHKKKVSKKKNATFKETECLDATSWEEKITKNGTNYGRIKYVDQPYLFLTYFSGVCGKTIKLCQIGLGNKI